MAEDDMTAELATADMEEETKERTVQERREAFIAAAENTEDPTALLEFVNQHVSPRPRPCRWPCTHRAAAPAELRPAGPRRVPAVGARRRARPAVDRAAQPDERDY